MLFLLLLMLETRWSSSEGDLKLSSRRKKDQAVQNNRENCFHMGNTDLASTDPLDSTQLSAWSCTSPVTSLLWGGPAECGSQDG